MVSAAPPALPMSNGSDGPAPAASTGPSASPTDRAWTPEEPSLGSRSLNP